MRKYTAYDLTDYTMVTVTINCSKCDRLDTLNGSEDDVTEEFFRMGWRATANKCYCKSCAKKLLKLTPTPKD